MAPDDILTYAAIALAPAITILVGLPALRAVHRESLSVRRSCALFVVAAAVGTALSFGLMDTFSYLLHGDGALGVVFAPMIGAVFTLPVALIFGVGLAVITSGRRTRKGDV
jgi:hypothetical protein